MHPRRNLVNKINIKDKQTVLVMFIDKSGRAEYAGYIGGVAQVVRATVS